MQLCIKKLKDRVEEIQAIVVRLASYKQMSDTRIDPLCSAVEAKARIEYAAKHASTISGHSL